MLRRLEVERLAILDGLALEFGPGLNVLSGETGAGKSLLLDGLQLALGGRGDPALIREGWTLMLPACGDAGDNQPEPIKPTRQPRGPKPRPAPVANADSATTPAQPPAIDAGFLAAPTLPPASPAEFELLFRPDPSIWDGRFANNGWLQECAKPVNKLTWDNAVLISPAIAQQYQLANGNVVELELNGRKLRGAVWIQP